MKKVCLQFSELCCSSGHALFTTNSPSECVEKYFLKYPQRLLQKSLKRSLSPLYFLEFYKGVKRNLVSQGEGEVSGGAGGWCSSLGGLNGKPLKNGLPLALPIVWLRLLLRLRLRLCVCVCVCASVRVCVCEPAICANRVSYHHYTQRHDLRFHHHEVVLAQ